MSGLLLHFFVNVSFAEDVEESLVIAGMGRPHHRILMVALQVPGVTINELLDVLHVSHQNLRLPIRKLVDEEYIKIRAGLTDRRQKQIFITPKGQAFAETLTRKQWDRIERTVKQVGEKNFDIFLQVQRSLLDPRDAAWANRLVPHQ